MAHVTVERIAGKRLEVRAGRARAIVDRSVEEGGAGDGFRSVELLLGALGSCTIGTMLTFADEAGIAVGAVRAELKAVTSLSTNTVTRAKLELHVDGELSDEDLTRLGEAAASCKVHRSLHDGVETTFVLAARQPAD